MTISSSLDRLDARTAVRLLSLSLLLAACGDSKATASASASTSAAPPPRCSDSLPQEQRVERCKQGEALCCTAMMSGVPKTAPDYFDKLALACKGGDESSCQVVRDSDRDAAYKLDALAQACTMIGRWPCRTAAMLAVLVAPERAPKVIDNYCRQTDDKTFRIAAESIDCNKIDKAALAPLEADAAACREGDLAGCKALAGVDGGARELFYDVAWIARGVPRAEAEKDRAEKSHDPPSEPKGRIRVATKSGSDEDQKAVRKAVEAEDEALRRCVGVALDSDEKLAGTLELELLLDKTGRVATTKVVKDLESLSFSRCLRLAIQDRRVVEPGGGARTVGVALAPSR
ncbi:MAG: hypothetical protein JNL21_29215 [Myxococcales bacterium]|nr:hypothetical protein [Myxococcales bacterium]